MLDVLDQIVGFISAHRAWAGPVVGLLSFVECLALVGILIPAPPLMIAFGGMIAGGFIDGGPVLLGAAAGAALGFIVSYFAGRWLGPGFLHRWPLKNYRRTVARSRLLFRRYAAAGVFVCRFFGPLRTTVPLVAGITGMNQRKFHTANALSALVWAPALMAPGWLAAKGVEQLEGLAEAPGIAVAAGAGLLAVIVVAVGFKIQRSRLLRRKTRLGAT
ncbi:MAG: DedA family protein [Alphaproteobacteria bacterium]|nr:DedA family protein [Alphaproteobacteria bacterium]